MRKVFEKIVGKENVLVDEPMSRHTTFKIGGPADFFVMPKSDEDVKNVYLAAKEAGLCVYILGNGSNVLVSDQGLRGVVICLYKEKKNILVNDNEIYAECGVMLSKVASIALNYELEGLEFASGIPGTVGGAVCMNAGAYGPEMKDVVKIVRYMDETGKISEALAKDCDFGYRKSKFQQNGMIVLGCTFALKHGDKFWIRERMNDYSARRHEKQPLDMPSAGSTFKRPEGNFAGALIEKANLKGYRIGGAQVSEKHAGFIVNNKNATAKDVYSLIEYVKQEVYKSSNIMLEPEVKLIGEFNY